MDRDKDTIWSRRTGSHKLSLSQNGDAEPQHTPPTSSRTFSSTKRYESTSSHGGRSNPFKDMPPLSTTGISSPSIRQSGASSAFGLGSGAFGFSSATKTPKTPGTGFDFVTSSSGNVPALPTTVLRGGSTVSSAFGKIKSATQVSSGTEDSFHTAPLGDSFHTASLGDSISTASVESAWPLRHNWVIWYKPPTGKNTDYEKSIKAMCRMTTAPEFWKVFVHLKCPSQLPVISEYHFFKEGIRAMWEDDENIRGGKWTIRLKKGVADLYWEELMMGMIGNQFAEASDEVCGAVLSVRSGEDILSVWTKNDGGRNVKIRETVKRVLDLPNDTTITWKSHDASITQRTAMDQARQEKNTTERRRTTLTQDDARRPLTRGSTPP